MTARQSHSDEETRGLASTLANRIDELAQDVASALRAEVDFYKSTRAVADEDLLASCTENLRFALKSLEDGVAFDTSPAVATGSRRAAAGVPLPAVMEAYRVASYRLWDAVVDIATENRGVSRDMVIAATRRIWRFHNLYTDAMANAYRQQNMHQVLEGTVTLIEKCSGAVEFEAVATEHRWVIHISGGSVGRGDLTPDREAVGHLGSPFGRAEQMPSRPEVCGDAAEGGQEPLRMPRRFEAFHRPFALPGGLMRVLGAVVQIPRPPVLHRRHELAVGDLVAAQLVGDQHARHIPQALEQLT